MEVLKTKRGVIIIIGFVLAVICLTIGIILLFNQDSKVEEVKEQNNNTKDEIKVEDGKETDIDDNNSQKSETEDNDNNLKVDEQQTQEDNKTNDNNSNTSTNNNSNNSSNTQKTTTKNINVDEPIAYSTQEVQEVNLPRGQRQTSQVGKNGVKRITYKVTYNSNGTEISRTKVSESVISQPVNQIIKVGVSDFNLNSDKLEFTTSILACTKDYVIEYEGLFGCDLDTTLSERDFSGIGISGKLYVLSVLKNNSYVSITPIIATKVNNFNGIVGFYSGNYNGKQLYFDCPAGVGLNRTLTQSDCDKYGLACGRW